MLQVLYTILFTWLLKSQIGSHTLFCHFRLAVNSSNSAKGNQREPSKTDSQQHTIQEDSQLRTRPRTDEKVDKVAVQEGDKEAKLFWLCDNQPLRPDL